MLIEPRWDAILRDDRIGGRVPDEIHPGVAWWTGAVLIQVTRTPGVVVAAGDAGPTTAVFAERFKRGAINSGHYAARVCCAGVGSEPYLRFCCRTLSLPGVHITADGDGRVSMRLFSAEGLPLHTTEAMREIHRRLRADEIPIPVNDEARGTVVDRRDLLAAYADATGADNPEGDA